MTKSAACPEMAHKSLLMLWTRHVVHLLAIANLPSGTRIYAIRYQALLRLDLSLRARVKCLRRLYRVCGNHGLLPRASEIRVSYNHASCSAYRGGYADVWKGKHCERDVAVKVIRIYTKTDLQKAIGVSCLS